MQVFVLTAIDDGGAEVVGVYVSAGRAMSAGNDYAEVELEWEISDYEAGLYEAQVETEDDPPVSFVIEAFDMEVN